VCHSVDGVPDQGNADLAPGSARPCPHENGFLLEMKFDRQATVERSGNGARGPW
jgi:hypothetical protein